MKAQIAQYAKESLAPDGAVDAARAAAVCDYIVQNEPPSRKIPVLRAYMKKLARMIAKEEALLECSGDVPPETLAQIEKFAREQAGGGKIRLAKKIDKSLLGGIRLKIADDVWEFSAKSTLDSLRPQ